MVKVGGLTGYATILSCVCEWELPLKFFTANIALAFSRYA